MLFLASYASGIGFKSLSIWNNVVCATQASDLLSTNVALKENPAQRGYHVRYGKHGRALPTQAMR